MPTLVFTIYQIDYCSILDAKLVRNFPEEYSKGRGNRQKKLLKKFKLQLSLSKETIVT